MRDLIVILVLYLVVLFAFGWCGGLRAAGKSIEDWGPPQHQDGRTTAQPGRLTSLRRLPFAAWMLTPSRSGSSAASSRSSARRPSNTRSR